MIVRLFGIAKEIVGNNKLMIDDAESISTAGELKQWLSLQYPALQSLQSWAIAVDSAYADDEKTIQKNSEVALLPPVSGG